MGKGIGVYKRVDKIEINYEDKIEIVAQNSRWVIFEIKIGKNEIVRIEVSKSNGDCAILLDIKGKKNKKIYVLTCGGKPRSGEKNTNKVTGVVEKKEIEVKEEKKEIEISSPIYNKAREEVYKQLVSYRNKFNRIEEERIQLERDLEKEVKNERGVDKRLKEVKEDKKNIKIKLNKVVDTPDNYTDDDVLKLFHELAKFSKKEKCLNDEKNKIKDRKKSIIAKKGVKTKEMEKFFENSDNEIK